MKTVLSAFVAAVTLSTLAIGCTNESTDSVNTDSAIDAFQNPTGSFDKSTGADAFSAFKAEKSESTKVSQPDGKSGVGTQSIRLMTRTLDAKTSCAEGQSCACAAGGSFSYQLEESKVGKAARFQFNKCVGESNSGFDGQAIILVTSKPILGIEKATAKKTSTKKPTGGLSEADDSSSSASLDQNVLFAAKGTAIEGQQKTALEFALLSEAGWTLLAVQVKDGKIVIGVAPNGNAFVKAKQGTWYCSPGTAKGYVCKSETGEDLEVEDAEQASVDEESDASETETDIGSEDGLPEEEDADESGF